MDLSKEGVNDKPKTKMQDFRAAQKKMNRELAALTKKRPTLGDGIQGVRKILEAHLGPEFAALVDGIYLGSEGSCRELLCGYPSMLIMDWYNGRLEVAYIS